MDFHLDALLNLPHATVEQCDQNQNGVILTLGLLNEAADCPHCGSSSDALNQSRSVMLRDLSVFGQATHLKVPRRQVYCRPCQQYFTERLPYVELGRQYTRRYEAYVYQQVQVSTIEQVSRAEGLTYDRVDGIFKHQDDLKKKRTGSGSSASPSMKSVTGKGRGSLPRLSGTLRLDDG